MQKLSMIEASAIIGGTCKETCTREGANKFLI